MKLKESLDLAMEAFAVAAQEKSFSGMRDASQAILNLTQAICNLSQIG